ncbi:MAG TPA: DUF559 domain-containing protein [Allosphingosinicella sp.]|nr:DUF559 domain-containing protein [Allosphingosinicella sp.]
MGVVRRTVSPHAAPLRQRATDAETALWFELRGRRLEGFKFKRQWTLGPYIVDLCCWERRLVVEMDGGQHSAEVDARRTCRLVAEGYRVLRFWNDDVLANMDGVLQSILSALKEEDPHPSLLPQAGEGAGGAA